MKSISDLQSPEETLPLESSRIQEQNLVCQTGQKLKEQEIQEDPQFNQKIYHLGEWIYNQILHASKLKSNKNMQQSFQNEIRIKNLYYLKGILISIIVFILIFIFFMILIINSTSSSQIKKINKAQNQKMNVTSFQKNESQSSQLKQKKQKADHEIYDKNLKVQNQNLKKFIQILKSQIKKNQEQKQKVNKQNTDQKNQKIIDKNKSKENKFKDDVDKFKFLKTNTKPYKQIVDTLKFWTMTGNNISQSNELQEFQELEKNYYQNKYQISKYKEVEICVVVLSYMNKANDRYKRSLDSIVQQDYSNYQVYYVDDNSPDKTGELVQNYIKDRKLENKIKLYRNLIRKKKSYNQFYIGQQNCKPGSIMIVMDGDDELIGRQVFKFLSAAYQISGSYYIYTNFLMIDQIIHGVEIGFSVPFPDEVIQTRNYRKGILTSHLRTWMSDLFLDIKKQDLFYKGDFPQVGEDLGTSFQLQQKAGTKVSFFSEFVYRYVTNTGLNDYALNRSGQTQMDKHYRKLPKFDTYNKTITLNIKS